MAVSKTADVPDGDAWVANFKSRSNRGRTVFHTDPDCPNFPDRPIPVDDDHIEREDLKECKRCAGDMDMSYERDHGYYHAALDWDGDDDG